MVHGEFVIFSAQDWVWYDRRTRTFICTTCRNRETFKRPITFADVHTYLLVHGGCEPDTPTLRPLP